MKLSAYAKKIGVSYRTAWNYFRAGKLNAYQTHTGTVIVREEDKPSEGKVAVSAAYRLRRTKPIWSRRRRDCLIIQRPGDIK